MSTEDAATSAFEAAVARLHDGADVAQEVEDLLALLSREERLWLLDGDDEFWQGMGDLASTGYNTRPIVMGHITRLGLPGLRFSDGPRGVVMGASTAFPVSMARGATWNVELEERVGRAIGLEMRAQGANFYGGVCINLPRHPAWGRAQETYSEDPLVLGEFGAALVRGVKRNAMPIVKHYALNSMENARFSVDVTIDEATLHEVFLPHFRRTIEAGADGVMTAYNSVDGEWAGENEYLMEDVLRKQWQFAGVTVSDFIFGLRDAAKSLRAGLDVEAPFRQQRAQDLPGDLESGRAQWADVDRAARRIIGTQLRFYASDLDPMPGPDVVFSDAHRALAREAAAEAVVLLKNDDVAGSPLLPLAESTTSIAVCGRLADTPNTGDAGSSNVRSPEVVTPLAGLRRALPNARITTDDGQDLERAAAVAAAADVAVLVVGYSALDEGEYLGQESMSSPELVALFPAPSEGMPSIEEMTAAAAGGTNLMGDEAGGDRASLRLLSKDVELIRAVAAANPRTVVVIVTAGAVITEEWRTLVPAVVVGWYSGSEGGSGLADALLGRTDITGRLPYSIPTTEEHLPAFDRDSTAKHAEYDRWFGQRLLDHLDVAAAFPLGFGLSYTTFSIDGVEVTPVRDEAFTASVRVTNTGDRRGRHVVQLYGTIDAADFPQKVLLGFAPVWLDAGQSATIEIEGSVRPLQRWTSDGFVLAAPTAQVEAAGHATDPAAVAASLPLE